MNRKNSSKKSVVLAALFAILVVINAIVVTNVRTSKNTASLTGDENLAAIEYEISTDTNTYNTETDEVCPNVKFSAFFAKNNNASIYANRVLGTSRGGDTLYMDIGVEQGGVFKNGVITIGAQNFTLNMNMLRDTVLAQDYVSNNVRNIRLNEIGSGTQELIMGNIAWNVTSPELYSANNTITLRGTFVPDEGEAIEITKVVNLTTDRIDGKASVNLKTFAQHIFDYNIDSNHDIEFVANLEYKQDSTFNEKNHITVNIPEKFGFSAKSVVVDDLPTDSYTYENGILNINDETNQNKKVYHIHVVYPKEMYEDLMNSLKNSRSQSFILPITAYSTCYNNPKSALGEIYQTDEQSTSALITVSKSYHGPTHTHEVETKIYPQKISNQKLLDAYDNGTTFEYDVNWRMDKVDWEGLTPSTYVINDTNKEGDSLDSLYIGKYTKIKSVSIKNNSIIPKDGKIMIYDDENNRLIAQFDATSSIYYSFTEDVKAIRIETTKDYTDRGGSLEVALLKEFDLKAFANDYSRYEIERVSELRTSAVYSGDKMPNYRASDYMSLVSPISAADISIDKDEFKIDEENPITANIKISIPDLQYKNPRWSNAKALVVIPKSVISYMELTGNNETLYEDDDYYFIKKDLYNPSLIREYTIGCKIQANQENMAGSDYIKLYYYNEACTTYGSSAYDYYDVNSNDNTDEMVGHSSCRISTIAPTTLLTYETISNYNDRGSITRSPSTANVENTTRKAKINVAFINGYANNVENVTIVGRIPTAGNEYVDGINMESTYTTHMTEEGLNLPEKISSHATVYYSESNTCNNDLNNPSNGWVEASQVQSFDNIKSYMLVMDSNSITRNNLYKFSYEIEIPEGIKSTQVSYCCHKVYFDLVTSEGLLETSTQTGKLGVRIVRYYDLNIKKHEAGSNKAIKNAFFNIDGLSYYSTNKTDENGELSFNNVIANAEYTLKENYILEDQYDLNENTSVFKVVEQDDGSLTYSGISEDLFDGQPTLVVDQNNRYKLNASVSDEPKYKVCIKKIDKDTLEPIQGAQFTLDNERFNTDENGKYKSNYISYSKQHTLTEVKCDGYYIEDPINFKFSRTDDGYTFDCESDAVKSVTVSQEEETGIAIYEITIQDEKIPTYDLEIVKQSWGDEDVKIAGASFNVASEKYSLNGLYETDENGNIHISGLYKHVPGRYITGEGTIREISVPEGYINNRELIKFVVSDNGNGGLDVNVENEAALTSLKSVETVDNKVIITIEDRQLFELKKVDADTQLPLANVGFVIYELDDKYQVVDYAKDVNGEYFGTIQNDGCYTVETDENGIIKLPLKTGKYKAVEYKFIEGYENKTHVEYFSISDGSDQIEFENMEVKYSNEWKTKEIYYIEDLVDLALDVQNGNKYYYTKFEIKRDLDFNDEDSYRDSSSTAYGDFNENGKVESIKEELTKRDGKGFLPITGIFADLDGLNHKIENIYINRKDASFYSGQGITISNITVSGNYEAKGSASGIGNASSLINCHSDVDINIVNDGGYDNNVYGVGAANNATRCHNEGNITIVYTGEPTKLTYINTYVCGVTSGAADSGSTTQYNVRECYNSGNIDISYAEGVTGNIEGAQINGVCGTSAMDCFNTGDISCHASYWSPNVSLWFSGINGGRSSVRCYNRGNITMSSSMNSEEYYVNGMAWGEVKGGYNTGNINCTGMVGVIYNTSSDTYGYRVTNTYYLDTSEYTPSSKVTKKGIAKTEEYMKTDAFVADLGTSFWEADTYNLNDGYPVHKWYNELQRNQEGEDAGNESQDDGSQNTGNENQTNSDEIVIEYIEDLIDITTGTDTLSGKTIKLKNDLDFNNNSSYRNYEDESYGDLNGDGDVKSIKEELTDRNGAGLKPRANTFMGTFDGQDHEIKNLYMNTNGTTFVGLFGVGNGATVRNLGISGEIIANNCTWVAPIIAFDPYITGTSSPTCMVENCYNKCNITTTNMFSGPNGIADVAGVANAYSVSKCYNAGNISVQSANSSANINVSGIGGTKVSNCGNTGNISATTAGYTSISGIAQQLQSQSSVNGVEVKNCYNTGNLEISSTYSYSGGLMAGTISTNAYNNAVNNCYYLNTATITAGYTVTNGQAVESSYMKSQNFINDLGSKNWLMDENGVNSGYPVPKKTDNTKIYSIEDLVNFSLAVNSGEGNITRYLENDLDFNSDASYENPKDKSFGDLNGNGIVEELKVELTSGKGFPVIGSYSSRPFTGTFDGKGHKIDGLYINTRTLYTGLFGEVINGKIKNLTVDGHIESNGNNLGLISDAKGSILIENCINKCTILGNNSNDISNYVSGLVGKVQGKITLNNCSNYGNITNLSGGYYTSGLVGYVEGEITINECNNYGNVTGTYDVAGLVANSSAAYIYNSNNYGKVEGKDNCISGICGSGAVKIDSCSNEGTILATNITSNVYVSGISSKQSGKTSAITNCINKGNITTNNTSGIYVGGICSYGSVRILNCENTGNITIDKNSWGYVGGIAGSLSSCKIEHCKNSGSINGTDCSGVYFGGISGYSADIEYSRNEGVILVTGKQQSNCYIGGITGFGVKNEYCYNTGDITVNPENGSNAVVYIGGIAGSSNITRYSYNIGYIDFTCDNGENIIYIIYVGGVIGTGNKVSYSYNRGQLDIDLDENKQCSINAGGIAGTIDSEISNSYNTSQINVNSITGQGSSSYSYEDKIGGIAGGNSRYNVYPSIKECYNTGAIKTRYITNNTKKDIYIGGIIGVGGNIERTYNTANIDHVAESNIVNNYVGGIAGKATGISDSYNQGDVASEVTLDINADEKNAFLGGIAGNCSSVQYTYNTGDLKNTVNKQGTTNCNVGTGAISGSNLSEGVCNNYLDSIEIIGENINNDSFAISSKDDSYMKGNVMYSELHSHIDNWEKTTDQYPNITIPVYFSDSESSEIEIKNNMLRYDITTEIAKNGYGIRAGGTITGEYTNDYKQSFGEMYVETIKYGNNSTVPIVITPNNGYRISKITINKERYEFTPDENGVVTIPSGYFQNVKADNHVIVEFCSITKTLTINKVDKDDNSVKLKGAVFNIYQRENRAQPVNKIGEFVNDECNNAYIDIKQSEDVQLGEFVNYDTNGFTKTGEKYKSNNSTANSLAGMYIPIDLTTSANDCYLSMSYYAGFGTTSNGVGIITESTDAVNVDSEGILMFKDNGYHQGINIMSQKLEKGKVYYLHVISSKGSSSSGYLEVSNIKLYEEKNETNGFDVVDGKYVSNNNYQQRVMTYAAAHIPIDLTNERGLYSLNVNISKEGNNSWGYLFVNTSPDTLTSAENSFYSVRYATASADASTTLVGGQIYYLHLLHTTNITSTYDSTQNKFAINSVGLELNDSNFIAREGVTTDETGTLDVELEYGLYEITEVKAPEGYELDNQVITHTIDEGTDNNITIQNKKMSEVVTHYYVNETGPEFDTDPVSVSLDKHLYGAVNNSYVTMPLLRAGKSGEYSLIRDNNHKYIIPDNYKGTYDEDTIDVYYYYELPKADYRVHYLYDGTEDENELETYNVDVGTTVNNYTEKQRDGYALSRVEGLPLEVEENDINNDIYVYYESRFYGYKVKYYYDDVLDDSKTEEGTYVYNGVIRDYTDKNIEGYKLDRTENLPLTISNNVDDNVISIYYVKDSFDYVVRYFYDGIEDGNGTEHLSAQYNTVITEYPDKKIEGYKLEKTEGLPLTISTDSLENVIKVYYVKDSFDYTVHYFYDGTEDISKKVTSSALFGNQITEVDVDTNKITGYKHNRTEGLPLTISANPDNNVINVYYVKDSFGYTVHYFYDGTEDESKKIENTALFGTVIEEVPGKNITGYKKDRTEGLPLTISATESENIVNVYYVKDSFGYTVHYFYDGTEDESKKIEDTAVFGTVMESVPDKNITGYKHDHTDGLPLTISATASENVVNVYYVKDSFGYTVHYFYDGTEDESKKIESTALFGTVIEEVPDKNITGYKKQKTEGLPLTISATASENVVNVYYIRDELGYSVHYFYDNVEDETKTINENATFGSVITEVPDKNITGYKHDRTEGLPLTISANTDENVINVYYVKDSFAYTVHYFYDNVEDESKKIEDTALFGTVISEVPEKGKEGYTHSRTDGLPLTISATASENVVNVYYSRIPDGTVIVKYVDNLTGETISQDTTLTGQIGNGYSVTRKTIPGHRLDEENLPNNETGTYKDTPQTVTYKYIKLRPYELVVRYSSGEGEHDEAKVLVHFGDTTINEYTTNGELHVADIELTDLGTENYTVYETETPEYCTTVVSEEHPAVVELIRRLNTEARKYEFVANYENIEGFKVIIDEQNKKVIFDITAKKDIKYDLALRKFITKIDDQEITDRVPQVLVSADNKITYVGNDNIEKAKNNQNITYTIRMYNESEIKAKGKRIVEYVPEGLVFVPSNEINRQYNWKMYKQGANGEAVEVTNAEEATIVVTDYLVGKDIKAFNPETKEISYLDVQAVFKVDESKITRQDRIVENKVQIVPNKYDDNTDNDVTTEKVYVQYFDLSVEKYIEEVVINTNGTEETRKVGYEQKGNLVKVDVKKSEAKNTKLTITYGILVKNVGEIPGYATEITDYIPEDFELLSNDEWTINGNKAVSTTLSDKLLNPGESTTLNITFEWDLAKGSIGTRRNEAEITEYANDYNAEDVTKDNKDGEDLLVTLKTGSEEIAGITAIAVFTAVVALGVLVIKRKVTKAESKH